jgi:hypothetical protein
MLLKILLELFQLISVLIALFEKHRKRLRVCAIIVFIAIFLLKVFQVFEDEKRRNQKLDFGILRPAETIIIGREKVPPFIRVGRSNFFLFTDGSSESNIQTFFKDNDLRITEYQGSLKISTDIRNKDGKVIAKVENNEWKIKPEKSFDFNYTNDALEIKDDNDRVIFQVRINKNIIELQGIFNSASGKSLLLTESGQIGVSKTPFDSSELINPIVPIFKYPRKLHFGELVEERISKYSTEDLFIIDNKKLEQLFSLTFTSEQVKNKEIFRKTLEKSLDYK